MHGPAFLDHVKPDGAHMPAKVLRGTRRKRSRVRQ
jgi:hypothetical protein